MSAFGPIINLIRKAQDQVQQVQREVYYTRSTFGIISSTRASGPSRLEQYVNEDGSSSDVKPSAPFSALMAPTEKFFKIIFNAAFINQITNLQASHFQLGVFMFKYVFDSRASRRKRRVKVQPPQSPSEQTC
jgi:hypothetical protein